jgi:hypothetical protein
VTCLTFIDETLASLPPYFRGLTPDLRGFGHEWVLFVGGRETARRHLMREELGWNGIPCQAESATSACTPARRIPGDVSPACSLR